MMVTVGRDVLVNIEFLLVCPMFYMDLSLSPASNLNGATGKTCITVLHLDFSVPMVQGA